MRPWSAEQQGQFPGPLDRVRVRLRDHVDHAGPAGVRLRAAEPGHVHVLAGHAAHHVGAGDEDPALLGEDHHVGQRGPVGGAARSGAEDHRDLRHHARGPGHSGEHGADRVQALDALAQPGTARVPQADHRRALRDGLLVGGHDRGAARGAHGAALHPGVAGERDRQHAVDLAAGGHRTAVVVRGQQPDGPGVEQGREAVLRVPAHGRLPGGGSRAWCSLWLDAAV